MSLLHFLLHNGYIAAHAVWTFLHIDTVSFFAIVAVAVAVLIVRVAAPDLFTRLKVRVLKAARAAASFLHVNRTTGVSAILAVFIFSQFSYLAYSVAQNADSWPIVSASDVDAANAIRLSERSSWLKHNGFVPYGNLYFNIAHTFAGANAILSGRGLSESSQENDRGNHFALMMISLCSLYGIALVMSFIIGKSVPSRLLAIFVIIGAATKNQHWMTWVFRAHPDILLTFLLTLSLFLTIRYLTTRFDGYLHTSAIVWGLALATKLSALYFLPMLVFVLIPPINKTTIFRAIRYFLTIAATFFIIGFPQNFLLHRQAAFLRGQLALTVPATLGSVGETFEQLANQFIGIFAAAALARVVVSLSEGKSSERIDYRIAIRVLALLIIPLVVLLARKAEFPFAHYTLPLAAGFAVLAAYLLNGLTQPLQLAGRRTIYGSVAILLLAIVSAFVFRFSPNRVSTILAEQSKDRPEARAVMLEIAKYQTAGDKIVADPYVPWDATLGNASSSFSRTFRDIQPGTADILVLYKAYYERYLEKPTSLYVQSASNWRETQAFYELFADKEQATDIYNGSWKKIYSSPLGWEIWKLQK